MRYIRALVQRTGRDACLQLVVDHLGATRVGRDLGLGSVQSLDDLRGLIPVRDRTAHEAEIEARLGFGGGDAAPTAVLGGAEREREQAVAVWRTFLQNTPLRRIALLRGRSADAVVDDILVDDLRALGGAIERFDRLDDSASTLSRLEKYDPELLVVPSAVTCRHLEQVHRAPLERRMPRLKMIFAEHDLRRPLRTRVRLRSAGWIHRSGRLGLPSARDPAEANVLAVGSQIIELLPYSNPEENGRRVYAEQTILPEQAILGHRYELVVTSPLGFLRMRIDEHVRVVGFDPPSDVAPVPRARVVRLAAAPPDVQLEGCTVAGAWLTASIRQALHREDPALVAAEIGADPLSIPSNITATRSHSLRLPDVFTETELGGLSRTGTHRTRRGKPRGLLFKIELQGYVGPDLHKVVSERIDQNLRRRSPAYAYLRERDELVAPRVFVVPAGTRRAEEERRVRDLLGGVWLPEVRVVVR